MPEAEQTNALWQRLEEFTGEDADGLAIDVRRIVDDAAAMLDVGVQGAPQFTLHDSGHAERVLDRMVDIIPQGTLDILGPLECAILILSAYLHDLGMSPERQELEAYENLLFDDVRTGLDEELLEEFLIYLANTWSVTELPLTPERSEHPRPWFVEQVITDWVRRNHVRTGWRIVEKHMAPVCGDEKPWCFVYGTVSYADWVKRVCQSHAEEVKVLGDATRFRVETIGTDREECNLRYLAMILRIADVLEFDRERVPPVLYQHQDINDWQSVVEWHKHFSVLSYRVEDTKIHLRAVPPRAIYYRAVQQMVTDIEREIRNCHRMVNEVGYHPAQAGADERYQFTLSEVVDADITEPPDSYVYIDAAFQPDTAQILKLFTGSAMYGGQPWTALRELLQNAFDAVREKQARTRLRNAEAGDDWRSAQGDGRVDVRFEARDSEVFLICTDTGVGMAREHIEQYVLHTGRSSSTSWDVTQLRWQCASRRIPFERTGTFGIGLLSYFMIADQLRFMTRRDQCCGATSGQGWMFETWGVNSFGELTKDDDTQPGTTVELHLPKKHWRELLDGTHHRRPARQGSPQNPQDPSAAAHALCESVVKAFRRYFAYVPCPVSFHNPEGSVETFAEGWVTLKSEVRDEVVSQLRSFMGKGSVARPTVLLDEAELGTLSRQQALAEEIVEALRIYEYETDDELELQGLRARVLIPYFVQEGRPCLAALNPRIDEDGALTLLPIRSDVRAWVPKMQDSTSYNGSIVFREATTCFAGAGILHRDHEGYCIMADILSSEWGQINVDRFSLSTSGADRERSVLAVIEQVLRDAHRALAAREPEAEFGAISRQIAGRGSGYEQAMHPEKWELGAGPTASAQWAALTPPFVMSESVSARSDPQRGLTLAGRAVQIVRPIGLGLGSGSTRELEPDKYLLPSTEYTHPLLVAGLTVARWRSAETGERELLFSPVLVWGRNPAGTLPPRGLDRPAIEFPPRWRDVVMVRARQCPGWSGSFFPRYNAGNPLVATWQTLTDDELPSGAGTDAIADAIEELVDAPTEWDRLSRLLALAAQALGHTDDDDFFGLIARTIERSPGAFAEAWAALDERMGTPMPHCVFMSSPPGYPQSWAISPRGVVKLDHANWSEYLPDPGFEWTLKLSEPDETDVDEAEGSSLPPD